MNILVKRVKYFLQGRKANIARTIFNQSQVPYRDTREQRQPVQRPATFSSLCGYVCSQFAKFHKNEYKGSEKFYTMQIFRQKNAIFRQKNAIPQKSDTWI